MNKYEGLVDSAIDDYRSRVLAADGFTTYIAVPKDVLEVLIEAARTTSYEYLNQAGKYAKLGQPEVERLTYEEHYVPIRDAIRAAESALA